LQILRLWCESSLFRFVSKLAGSTWPAFGIPVFPSFNKLITTVYINLLGDIGESATETATKMWFEIVDGRIVYFDQTDAIAISSDN
jgi:hypothetical protein